MIKLFKEAYLPIGDLALRPCLKALILAVMPGLEEEGNEFFDEVSGFMQSIRSITPSVVFFNALWAGFMLAPQHRHGYVNYLTRNFPRCETSGEIFKIFGDDLSFMTNALSAALTDSDILVQRGTLELLVVNFPLDQNFISEDHTRRLFVSALGVVLRKDMSLNRRLYAWLLGPGETPAEQSAYFAKYTLASAVKVLSEMFFDTHSGDQLHFGRPYKILVSLLDKSEIGGPVSEQIFFPIIISLKIHVEDIDKLIDTGKHTDVDIIHAASNFADMLDPHVVFRNLYHLFHKNCIGETSKSATDELELLVFFLQRIKLRDEDVASVHVPFLYFLVLAHMQVYSNFSFSFLNIDNHTPDTI